jgi:soluble lytic murein transglycosylase
MLALLALTFFDFQECPSFETVSHWANEAVIERYAKRLHIPVERSRQIISQVRIEARIHKAKVHLVLGMIQVESGGDPHVISHAGAMGLMQILPSTGEWIAEQMGEEWGGTVSLLDIKTNLRYGIWYLKYLERRFGNAEAAIAAYFWGPGNISKRLRVGTPLPTQYTQKVLRAAYGY